MIIILWHFCILFSSTFMHNCEQLNQNKFFQILHSNFAMIWACLLLLFADDGFKLLAFLSCNNVSILHFGVFHFWKYVNALLFGGKIDMEVSITLCNKVKCFHIFKMFFSIKLLPLMRRKFKILIRNLVVMFGGLFWGSLYSELFGLILWSGSWWCSPQSPKQQKIHANSIQKKQHKIICDLITEFQIPLQPLQLLQHYIFWQYTYQPIP